jgi:4'-phosphopantetheinyl transferase
MQRGVVEVWRADLAAADDAVATLLSADERERAAGFARAQDGRRWGRARGILRALLGDYVGTDPSALRFAADAGGKPELVEPSSSLRFNLSHSGEVALYAFACDRAVGVDVEVERERATDLVAVARRAFGAGEAERLGALAPEARRREFLRAWARYEAELKCGVEAPWVTELDVGEAAALAVEGGPCEVRVLDWASSRPRRSG